MSGLDLSVVEDDFGRLVCTLHSDETAAIVTSAEAASASQELLAALDEVRQTGYGECFWQEAGGQYRWMFRRAGEQVTVAALWSSGTLTGWEHVLQVQTDFETFAGRMSSELTKVCPSGRFLDAQ